MNNSEKIKNKIEAFLNEDVSTSSISQDHYHKYQIDFSGNGKTLTTYGGADHTHMVLNHEMQFAGNHKHEL